MPHTDRPYAELTVEVERETLSTGEDVYVALCLELDVADQGATVEEAKSNLVRALTLFFETAPEEEIERRLPSSRRHKANVFTTRIEVPLGKEVPLGQTASAVGSGRL